MTAVATLRTVPRSEHVPKFIRFPVEVAETIAEIARRERRTFTAQLMLIIEQWLEDHQSPKKSR